MSKILALLGAQWRVALSYRLQTFISFAGLIVTVVPLYFIAQAVQPVMAESIRAEGGSAFGFLLVGMSVMLLVAVALSAVPSALASGIGSGTLEAMLSTPTSMPTLLVGISAFPLVMAGLRAGVLLAGGWLLGAEMSLGALPIAVLILALIVLAHASIGLISGAMVLAFRTAGPLSRFVVVASSLLGGVYYPTHVIPSWLQAVSEFLPLSYGLRALRPVLLQGAPLASVARDLLILVGEAAFLFALGAALLALASRYARRQGTLAQY
jgi:ABC-2 type transport system permease protein